MKPVEIDGRLLFPFRYVARVVRMHRSTLRRAAELGTLDYVQVGSRKFNPRSEVLRLMRERDEK